MRRVIGFAAILIFSVGMSAFGGVNSNAKVTVHVLPHGQVSKCTNVPVISGCDDIIVTEASGDVDAFPVFFDLEEYQGFDYGMTWPGAYTCAFTSCSDMTIGDIVNPGDGISHAWYDCQPSPVAVVGWGWISEPAAARICIVANPGAGYVIVGDCSSPAVKDTLPEISLGCAGIGGESGDPPCDLAIKPTTWGGIKSIFR